MINLLIIVSFLSKWKCNVIADNCDGVVIAHQSADLASAYFRTVKLERVDMFSVCNQPNIALMSSQATNVKETIVAGWKISPSFTTSIRLKCRINNRIQHLC